MKRFMILMLSVSVFATVALQAVDETYKPTRLQRIVYKPSAIDRWERQAERKREKADSIGAYETAGAFQNVRTGGKSLTQQQAARKAREQQKIAEQNLRAERLQAYRGIAPVPISAEEGPIVPRTKRKSGVVRAMEGQRKTQPVDLAQERMNAYESLEIPEIIQLPRRSSGEIAALEAGYEGRSQGLVPLGKGREALEGLEYTRAPRSAEYLRGYEDVTSEMPDYKLQDLRAYKKLEREPIALPQMGEIGGAGLPYDTGLGRKYATWRTTPYGQYRFRGAHLPESDQYYTPTLTAEGAKRAAYGLASGLSSGVSSGLRGAGRLGYEYGYQPIATGAGYVSSGVGSVVEGARRFGRTRRIGSEYLYQPVARKLGQAYSQLPSSETVSLHTLPSFAPAKAIAQDYMSAISAPTAENTAAPVQRESTTATPSYWESAKSYIPTLESIKGKAQSIWENRPSISVEGQRNIINKMSDREYQDYINELTPGQYQRHAELFGLRPQ